MLKKVFPLILFVGLIFVFFWQVFLKGLLPIPADTIVGLYHPYRDLYASSYPNGTPYKNFLITDPVRQQYPWKQLSVTSLKDLKIPTWNPYALSGTPNVANFQSGAFYPVNLLSLLLPFEYFWTIYIILSPLLAGIFMYAFLRNLKLGKLSGFFGGVVFAFCGFSTVWLEWGNVMHTALWLPLILLSLDKIISGASLRLKLGSYNINSTKFWGAILCISLVLSFFAGHLQVFFYIGVLSLVYAVFRLRVSPKKEPVLSLLGILLVFILITAVQWIPSLKFINLSARSLDQNFITTPGWFLPWQNMVQFLVPDFFGNPSTLNYWGVWNYGELTGYVGIVPLALALIAIFFRRSKEVLFFFVVAVVALVFALPDLPAKIPFLLNLPFISTAQPTRLLFLVDFSLVVLASIGFEHITNKVKLKELAIILGSFLFVFVALFYTTKLVPFSGTTLQNLLVAQRNMIFPVVIFLVMCFLLIVLTKTNKNYSRIFLIALIILTLFDLFRFSWKFNTFSKKEYLFPSTKSLSFLQQNLGISRFSTADPRIMPPNFSLVYKLNSVEGYDSLYLQRYGEFVSAINRNKPDISPPFGFNRIVRVTNYDSNLYNLLGTKYLLTLTDIIDPKFVKVFQEGQTRVYENQNVYPRAFLAQEVINSRSKQQTIDLMFDRNFDPLNQAIVEKGLQKKMNVLGNVSITSYKSDRIDLQTETDGVGFLVLTDVYYPSWRAKIDGKSDLKIYQTDYVFRGVFVPRGKHTITFYNSSI